VVHDLREGRLSREAWRQRARDLGIAGVSLRVGVAEAR
jgi:hypothetical protein